MSIAIITGSSGLVGSEAVRFFARQGLDVVGIDNDLRGQFFGEEASVDWNRRALEASVPGFRHQDVDLRDLESMRTLFRRYASGVEVIIHAAAQPSHDWAASDPHTDFTVNANATLNLLELTREHCPEAVFVYMSTNKVYGDTPNRLPLLETETRFEIDGSHPYHGGIDESMSIDHCMHSLFGVSKTAGDLLVQEYARYFGLKTGLFRGGCITGPAHSGAALHGFLAYLMQCTLSGEPYTVFGYQGKQVRDNLHSADLVGMMWHFFLDPRPGEVYNAGGGRHSNCSMLEAIDLCEGIAGRPLEWTYRDESRAGDHIWWISDVAKFRDHYPDWEYRYDLTAILEDVHAGLAGRA